MASESSARDFIVGGLAAGAAATAALAITNPVGGALGLVAYSLAFADDFSTLRAEQKRAELAKVDLDTQIRKANEARNARITAEQRTAQSQSFARELEATREQFSAELEKQRQDFSAAEADRRAATAREAEAERERFSVEQQQRGQEFSATERTRGFEEQRARDAERVARDTARAAELDARHTEELNYSRVFQAGVEQRRAEETRARLELEAASLLERQQEAEQRRKEKEAAVEAQRRTFFPLEGEVLTPPKILVQRVLNGGGAALVRAQDAVALGLIGSVTCIGGGACGVSTIEGRPDPRGAAWNAANNNIVVRVTTDDLIRAGLVSREQLRAIEAEFRIFPSTL